MEAFCFGEMPTMVCAFVNENAVGEVLGFPGKEHAKCAGEYLVLVIGILSFFGKPMDSCPRAP